MKIKSTNVRRDRFVCTREDGTQFLTSSLAGLDIPKTKPKSKSKAKKAVKLSE